MTSLSDNKTNDLTTHTQVISNKNLNELSHLRHRMSPSLGKRLPLKRLNFPLRNQSFHREDGDTRCEAEGLLKKQKIMLMAQKIPFNQLLIPPPDIEIREKELIFPSLQVRKVAYTQIKSSVVEKQIPMEFKLEDISYGYQSNIVGQLSQVSPEGSNGMNWVSQKKIDQLQEGRKSPVIKKKVKNSSNVQWQPHRTEKGQKGNAESPSSPSPFSRIRSQTQIEMTVDSPVKKYKRGYLPYGIGGVAFWEKMKVSLQKPAKLSVSSKLMTAKIFYGFNMESLEPMVAHQAQEEIEIASLSKIMTCYLSLLIGKKYGVDLKECWYRVSDWITETPGTSAELQAGDILSAYDLLFALMLPSGNDASLCLAEMMGKVIHRHRKSEQKRTYIESFLLHMNLLSKELGLNQEWGNSHGLPANPNISTAKAIVGLTALALQQETFRAVINTTQYEIVIKNDRYGLSRKKFWKNTNKLLQRGWQGVKTGTTDSAGHCLMALKDNLLLGLFDCQTLSKRFCDAIRLNDYILSHINK